MAKNKTIQLFRSASAKGTTGADLLLPKAPLATDLQFGEIAINYLSAQPTFYIKDADGVVREFKDVEYLKTYVSTELAKLVGDAPATLNTLDEIAAALKDNSGIVDTLNAAIGAKADKARVVGTGNGLQGGGDLTTDRSLSIKAADDSLSVAPAGLKVDTVNALNSTSATKPLSAAQGKALYDNYVAFKTLFDELFEKDANGFLKVKKEMYGVAGITAYSDGTVGGGGSAGGAISGLSDVILTGLAAGNLLKYNGTHWVNIPQSDITPTWANLSGKPTVFQTNTDNVSGLTGLIAAVKLDHLADVSILSTANNHYIGWNGTSFVNRQIAYAEISGTPTIPTNGSFSFSGLSDTLIATPVTGNFARWNGTKWVNVMLAAGDIPVLDWGKITTGKPTTLAGYGISDAAPSSHVGAGAGAHAAVSTTVAGFMSSADKVKLDAIASGAKATLATLTDVAVATIVSGNFLRHNGTAWVNAMLAAGDIPVLDWSKITTGKPTTLAGYGISDAAPSSHVGAGATAHAAVSTTVAGFMSAADKVKLDGIAASANNYVHPTTAGNIHVPAGGAAGSILEWSALGTAAWATTIDGGTF